MQIHPDQLMSLIGSLYIELTITKQQLGQLQKELKEKTESDASETEQRTL